MDSYEKKHKTQMDPTSPPKQPDRTTYNQVRLVMRGEGGETGHPVGPNTDGMPTLNFFHTATPKRDSYAEILGKSNSLLGTLVGAQRAVEGEKTGQDRETEKLKPFKPTPSEEM